MLNIFCKPQYGVTNIKFWPHVIVIPCEFLGGIVELQCCNDCHLPSHLFIQISIIRDNISSQVVDKRRYGFSQWMNSFIIHDNIWSLIHKKYHPKNYQSHIKYHMIFSVVSVQDGDMIWSAMAHKHREWVNALLFFIRLSLASYVVHNQYNNHRA